MVTKKIGHISYLVAFTILLVLGGCDKQMKMDDYVPDSARVEGEEVGEHHIFESNANFDFSAKSIAEMDHLLKETMAHGVDNIAFIIVSNKPVSVEHQEKVQKMLMPLMHKYGFMNSRIINRGVCIYENAKPSLRISVLRYQVKEPDCSPWSEYVGDTDTNKNLPKYGFCDVYNLEEMIANKADLVAPRNYKGATGSGAVGAIANMSSGGGGGS